MRSQTVLGALAIAFYMAHARHYVAAGLPENLLWSCHIAALAVGFGLLFHSPTLNAIGFLWELVGVPLWLGYVATGGELIASSLATHTAGLGFGFYGLTKLGLPGQAWWKALLGLIVLHGITRFASSPKENVNLAFAVWPGWETWFPSHALYLVTLLGLAALAFASATAILKKSGLVRDPSVHET